eukprot:tig00021234_g19383.t1
MKLIGWTGCPFTQRVWLALEGRGIPYEFELIDPLNKPDWFLLMNPKGQVPVLVHNGKHLRESLVQIYYLEDAFPSSAAHPTLLPGDPYERAQARLWVEWCGSELNPAVMALLRAKEEADRPKLADAVAEKLRFLSAEMPTAPAFASPTLTLVDCVLVPILQRLEHVGRPWRGYGIPEGTEYDSVRSYLKRMEASPAVQRGSFSHEELMDYYTRVWLKH